MSKKKQTARPPSPAVTHFPSPILEKKSSLSHAEKLDLIAKNFKEIMEVLGLDLSNESLIKTPDRVAKMYLEEVFSGLDEDNFPDISFFENEVSSPVNNAMVILKVSFTSFCEHHFVPMTGSAYIAYLPSSRIIGISKIHRLVHYFASRPQLQERLTAQIADSLAILLQSEDIAASIDAKHYCVAARGVYDENGHAITNVLRGRFSNDDMLRREFFEGINRKI